MSTGWNDKQELWNRIVQRTSTAFGRAVHPHLFRDIAATTIAVEHPEAINIAVGLLGHGSPLSTQRYVQAQAIEASRLYSSVMDEMKTMAQKRARTCVR